jgi:hypothetical protein
MRTQIGIATLIAVLISASCARDDVAGRYVSDRDRSPKDSIVLAADGTFTAQEDGGSLKGTYKRTGTQVAFTLDTGQVMSCTLEGAVLTDSLGNRWTKE